MTYIHAYPDTTFQERMKKEARLLLEEVLSDLGHPQASEKAEKAAKALAAFYKDKLLQTKYENEWGSYQRSKRY